MQQNQVYDSIVITIDRRAVIKQTLRVSNSFIEIKASQVDLVIVGDRNKVNVRESAGRLRVEGSQNHLEMTKSWFACSILGNVNVFQLEQSEFQLKEHEGEGNFVPHLLGDNHRRMIPIMLDQPLPLPGGEAVQVAGDVGVVQGGQAGQMPPQLMVQRILNMDRNMRQQRIINMRINMRNRHENFKRLLPNLVRSSYESEERECAICYDDMRRGDSVLSLFCFHIFHADCIECCLESSTKCPVCSLDLMEHINGKLREGSLIRRNEELLMKESLEEHRL